MDLSIEVYQDKDNTYVASCSELDIHNHGETLNEAVNRLREVVNFYVASAEELGIDLEELSGKGVFK